MHGLATAGFEQGDAESVAEVSPEPVNAGLVRHVAADAEQIPAAADKVGGVEDGLIVVHDEGDRLARLGEAIVVVVKFIDQRRARRGGPPRPPRRVLLTQWAVGVHLEVTRPPGHWRLDDLIADDEKPVSRAGRAEALRLPVRRLIGDGEIRHRRAAHGDTFRLEDVNELIQLALGRAHDEFGIGKPGDQLIEFHQPLGDVKADREVFGRDHRTLEAPDHNLLERIPFVVRTNR